MPLPPFLLKPGSQTRFFFFFVGIPDFFYSLSNPFQFLPEVSQFPHSSLLFRFPPPSLPCLGKFPRFRHVFPAAAPVFRRRLPCFPAGMVARECGVSIEYYICVCFVRYTVCVCAIVCVYTIVCVCMLIMVCVCALSGYGGVGRVVFPVNPPDSWACCSCSVLPCFSDCALFSGYSSGLLCII